MSLSLILACLWVLAAVITAMLPMRLQYPPGITLLILAPVLIGYIWVENGAVFALLACAGFVSMFRRPLTYFLKRLLQRRGELGK
ncbi:DUF2484 family protein [Actibacterium ureilyticum]|uniref:DUF2484 family protein n=1 Tax=Actibacterium ureilyticum TaxID=1590614 RepID=UPI001595E504|nr:DUF2484 family protein [Actibacterium ureilyticum]